MSHDKKQKGEGEKTRLQQPIRFRNKAFPVLYGLLSTLPPEMINLICDYYLPPIEGKLEKCFVSGPDFGERGGDRRFSYLGGDLLLVINPGWRVEYAPPDYRPGPRHSAELRILDLQTQKCVFEIRGENGYDFQDARFMFDGKELVVLQSNETAGACASSVIINHYKKKNWEPLLEQRIPARWRVRLASTYVLCSEQERGLGRFNSCLLFDSKARTWTHNSVVHQTVDDFSLPLPVGSGKLCIEVRRRPSSGSAAAPRSLCMTAFNIDENPTERPSRRMIVEPAPTSYVGNYSVIASNGALPFVIIRFGTDPPVRQVTVAISPSYSPTSPGPYSTSSPHYAGSEERDKKDVKEEWTKSVYSFQAPSKSIPSGNEYQLWNVETGEHLCTFFSKCDSWFGPHWTEFLGDPTADAFLLRNANSREILSVQLEPFKIEKQSIPWMEQAQWCEAAEPPLDPFACLLLTGHLCLVRNQSCSPDFVVTLWK